MDPAGRSSWRFDGIGTAWQIDTEEPLSEGDRTAVLSLVDEFDRTWSRFRADSTVSRLAEAPGTVPAPPDAKPMLDLFSALDEATGGAVNPLVGESLAHRGYDAALSLRDRGAVSAPADWREVLGWADGALTLGRPARIDVGALGKGRLVDLVLALLGDRGHGTAVVDGSGDLAVRGTTLRVALEHPYDPRRAIGVVDVADRALCASAVNRRAWGDGLHHVLDARTGEPVRTIAATWAIAATAMAADAAATALFFDGGPAFAHAQGVEWVRMTTAGAVEWSPGSTAELFR
ncbi:thiamine biosynthesis lipoprotein [Microbacterium resistens]|uniref:FAD:protein FMN transferase n=1 Tax=Microbacterium resistens TaxID=156977 RepID=A0ABU1S7T4_9MICO|nr:FAD:protein FMN transferase [Microbacterium resistens]MDR6865677.1 thiamine biosynthesis lipoprotein [Microbacterium resistens]